MLKDIRHESSFTAVDESGNTHIIDVFVEVHTAGTLTDPNATVDGLKRLRTTNGEAVNRLEKGKYEIVQSGVILQSAEPDAP